MNPWILIISQYGLPFALELSRILNEKEEPTTADFEALVAKYGTKTAADYLKEAEARAKLPEPLKP